MTPPTTCVLLALICVLSFAIRLFPVVIWGSVIHEFDPQFNFRVTKFLAQHGVYELLDWFDDRAWYPLGRIVGTTVYPGLMAGAAGLQWLLTLVLRLPISIRDACVFLAPVFAALACVAQFLLTQEVTGNTTTALLSAMLLSVSPAYISRSTAGSFDNEGIAIFLLIFTFYLWVKAVKTGAMLWAALAAVSYFGMALSWGGYVFIINIVPIYVLALLLSGHYSPEVYIAYSTFYPLATLGAMQVPFIGFNAVLKGENAGSHGVFALLQAYAFMQWMSTQIPRDQFMRLLRTCLSAGAAIVGSGLLLAFLLGKLQWSGRSLTLLDPTYASKYIPIIASVGEHQPTVWSAFYFSLGPAMLFIPLGVFYSFQKLDAAFLFMIVYSTFAFYFSGIMVRLLLTLAPAACYLSAVGASGFMHKIVEITRRDPVEAEKSEGIETNSAADETMKTAAEDEEEEDSTKSHAGEIFSTLAAKLYFQSDKKADGEKQRAPRALQLLVFACGVLLIIHARHSSNIAKKVYSSTSLVFQKMNMTTKEKDLHDDYREAFAWLRQNTPEDAKILSWWDYGYQITTLANRTVLVDNNTWNNTHIATVGRVLTSREDDALPILRSLDVDYVFLLFGGNIGMPGDDLDKLPWIVKISEGVFPDDVIESEFQVNGRYIFHENATLAMTESVLYKLSYFEFNQVERSVANEGEDPVFGWDMSRRFRIPQRDINLQHFEHVFTSDAWMVRIYRVKSR
ncbi:Dolichyl-diphosphooligosaccharide--protein glycosyltransferase subunit [Phytophthora cactorum]|uniref:dolichyl-diphosphooligosaccharide--protein glycotransferase n=1 Tax=Phytophthora cactorum TaxID=29920 RepID=A0A329SPE4_9STRA|nr:Dolichyl-diphosphooligosaccharide--protein glycosyltransferase subunit [Phytophthora cactorum]KAG2842471.1 Dolichyl-diphosphooligosaccharide--protein glycosyltransferase subunit [Phytophthora cactorum]KAG2843618.1 Dolichyl-diphosphooligosaccharide--protein glycosyltransferase subunit [Phytophthora cactorum]KAG2866107.1 Dolichyl-diphosphooligosaccharide--protein glycosyltransferase subunit [Phytophthora cactorum]KAG2927044.1 Dolichyl-diphosphooligosaccharide--protein glycosyltransferase subun